MLEQLISLESLVHKRIEKSYFIAGDLERLSASVLYTSDLPPMTSAGCFDPNFRRESFSQPAWSNMPRAENSPQNYEVKPLFFGDSKSAGNDFRSASSYGVGPGIARKMPEAEDMIERVRKDDDSPSHLNYEYLIPGKKTASGKQKYINLANFHIDLED